MRRRRVATVTVGLLGAAGLVVAGATPAAAHTHPTPVELDAPAVVQVRTDAVVNISLIEHHQTLVPPHIELTQRSYTVPLATNSGFAVDPTGAIVTTGRAVDVDVKRAEVFAVNQVFHGRYGDRAPLPADPYSRMTIVKGGSSSLELNSRLQQCYKPNTTGESGGCVVATSREVRVLPFVTDQRQYGDLAAEVLYPPAGQRSDVAVLRVGASSMPTVRLAAALEGAAYSVLGFRQTPTDPASQVNVPGHFAVAGKPELKRDEKFAAQLTALRHGVQGGPVVGEKGNVVGFLHADGGPADASSRLSLVGPDKLREALQLAHVVPRQGPTDFVYENASHDYKNALYAAAVPNLTKTLTLYPGHALASAHLADATAKQRTAADNTGKADTRLLGPTPKHTGGGWLVPFVVVGVGLVALALLVLVRRRSGASGRTAPPPAPALVSPYPVSSSPVSSSPVPAAEVAVPREGVDSGAPTMARGSVPQQVSAQSTDPGGDRDLRVTQPPGTGTGTGTGTARARAGAGGGAQERSSRARAAATSAGPFLGAVQPSGGRPQQAPVVVRPCRVCGRSTSPDVESCEGCGHPTT